MIHHAQRHALLKAAARPVLLILCLFSLAACRGNKESQIEELQQQVWLNPEDARAYFNLGKAYARREKYREAIDSYKRAIALEPGLDEAYAALGAAYFNRKEFNEALPWMLKRVEIAPDDSLRNFDLGNVYFQLKQYDDAIASYRKAIDNSYSFDEAWYTLAISYIRSGRLDEARKIHAMLQQKNNYLAVALERHMPPGTIGNGNK